MKIKFQRTYIDIPESNKIINLSNNLDQTAVPTEFVITKRSQEHGLRALSLSLSLSLPLQDK